MRSFRQAVATEGNGFGLLAPVSRGSDLRPVAKGCNQGAP
jgi:hypothetical protein